MKKTSLTILGRRKNRPAYNKAAIQSAISHYAEKTPYNKIHLNCIIMNDEELLEMNRAYLNHDYYTDIITFDLSVKQTEIIGELYISLDRVTDNAIQFHVSRETELLRVMFHGFLHLTGLKDKTPKQTERMRQAEEECLNLYHQYNMKP